MFHLWGGLVYKIENLILFPVLATAQSCGDVGGSSSARLTYNKVEPMQLFIQKSLLKMYILLWIWKTITLNIQVL